MWGTHCWRCWVWLMDHDCHNERYPVMNYDLFSWNWIVTLPNSIKDQETCHLDVCLALRASWSGWWTLQQPRNTQKSQFSAMDEATLKTWNQRNHQKSCHCKHPPSRILDLFWGGRTLFFLGGGKSRPTNSNYSPGTEPLGVPVEPEV